MNYRMVIPIHGMRPHKWDHRLAQRRSLLAHLIYISFQGIYLVDLFLVLEKSWYEDFGLRSQDQDER
jgi:hypothetical protein